MPESRYIGKETPRPDAVEKLTGRAEYIHDMRRPGMLHAAIKFSEHAHARILNVDASRAEALPGVRAVLTGFNTPEIRVGFLRDNTALKRDRVRQFRDEIAAVAATDPDTARQALDLIRVDYDPLPAVFDPDEALRDGAPLIHETDARGKPLTTNRLALRFEHHSGIMDEARRASRHIAEGVFTTPRIQQSCLGTAGCIAEFDGRGNLTMWAKTQIPFLAQRDFQRALRETGLSTGTVRVVVPALGGGFGTGLDTHPYEYIAILLAHRTGCPVKVLYTREEEFACLSPRQGTRVRIAQGCDDEGRLTFRDVHVLQDNGAYTSWGATYPSVMLLPATSLYRVPCVSFDSTLVYTNNTYCQAMRGYGNPEITFPVESTLDDLAGQAGIDPLDMRLLNANQPGDTTPMDLEFKTCGMEECLRRAGALIGWKDKRGKSDRGTGAGENTNGARVRRGVGIAALVHVGGGGKIYQSDGSGCILKFDDFGGVTVYCGGVEMGQGLHSALMVGVAEMLGVPPGKIRVAETDTATCPWDVGTHASRGAYMALAAAKMACEDARRKIFAAAEELLPGLLAGNVARWKKKRPEDEPPAVDPAFSFQRDRLDLAEGEVFCRDLPDHAALRVPLERVLRGMHFRDHGQSAGGTLTVTAFYEPDTTLPDWERGVGNLSENYAFGAQAAEVEVDLDTGVVRVVAMSAVHDVGRVLNLQTLKGQTHGALAQGVGYALCEQVLTKGGRVLNPNFTDYKIPTARDMNFPVHMEFVETIDPSGALGIKGVGEPGLVPTAPAIAAAIRDAVGVTLRDLPMTAERVLEALGAFRDAEAR